MSKPGKPIPEGYHTITPYLTVKGAEKAIEFYKKALGAQETVRMPGPDGRGIVHAELKIGDSIIMLHDEMPENKSPQSLGGSPVGLYLYLQDVDAAFKKAVAAGAQELQPVQDMFWGDRVGQFKDPFGHFWTLATHKEDLTPEEVAKRGREFFAQMASHR